MNSYSLVEFKYCRPRAHIRPERPAATTAAAAAVEDAKGRGGNLWAFVGTGVNCRHTAARKGERTLPDIITLFRRAASTYDF